MALGDLEDALALAAVLLESGMVQYQGITADVLTFEAGAPHSGAHPFDDQIAFEFSDGADDDVSAAGEGSMREAGQRIP